ncbi:hypothetical protein GTY65_00830 [Streptomyces sp. SID8379]|uniref:baeRF2 domain-containing protein n=1 Tax=unclassified Streptomyces TaxID=2593676 RepID=UPI0003639DDA|nr:MULTISPECIES: hypothetical protein [unclassified Streptomyces]MYW62629.1 hypothetical protein [Streptomyces sp. SID8379]
MDLAFLSPLFDRPGPWASVYVDAARHRESTDEERTQEALGVQRALAAAGADEATCHAVRLAVDELRHTGEPVGRAFFATRGEVVLDPALSTAPPGTSACWAALPHTTPLLDLAGADPLCLVAYVDPRGVELELRSAGGMTGWPERHVELRVQDTEEADAAEIAEALTRCRAETRADVVVLVGGERACEAVRDRLPGAVRERALRTRHGAGSRLRDAEVAAARAEYVGLRAAHEVELFDEGRGCDGVAAEGVPAVVHAARGHRISELLIRADGDDAGRQVWVGAEPDQVGVRREDLVGPRAAAARADDALMRCAVAGGAGAVSVAGVESGGGPVGGLGALLRWGE